jgi:hypothetical protein
MNQVIEEKHRPVHHLQALYTVVVGIALTVALTELIDAKTEVPFRLSVLPYFLAYVVTLVPFYHGALRHLDVTYVHNAASRPRSGALMADWGLLFCESCLLLAIALLVARPRPFSYALISLLLFDTVWAFVAHLAFSPPGQLAELRWAKMNLVTSGMLILTMVYLHSLDASTKPIDTYMWIVVLTVCVLRTIVDYSWCWSFYYPGGTNEEAS